MSSNNAVLFETKGPVGEIILNRPEQLNSMDRVLIAGLEEAVNRAESPDVRVVVLRGNGRCFCAGGDIKYFNQMIEQGGSVPEAMPDQLHVMIEKLQALQKPVLASVHGAAAGAGAPLALACDLVIASEESVFNFAYARIGLSPDGSSTYFLPRHVGMKKAMEIFMMTPTLSAAEAKTLGLVNWLAPADQLAAKTAEIAGRLAQGPTKVYGRLKKLLLTTFDNDLHEQLALETRFICESSRDRDFREGVQSFLQKAAPKFEGK